MLRGLRYLLILSLCLGMAIGGIPHPAWARDLSRQTPQDKAVELGTADNQLVFVPKELFFATATSTVCT